MTTKYFAILTNQGAARLANATMLGTKLNITQMAVGDGNGTLPTPDPAQTKLINQTRIAPINSLSVDANDAGQIIAEQIIPENEGGFFIREIGLYDDDGILIAVANCPETYKPLLAEGSGRTQTIRMILVVSSTSAITLKIDPSVVLATRKYVDDAVIEVKSYADGLMRNHEQSRNHPDATTTAKGFTQLNSSVTDDRETQSATPKAVKIAMDNANARLAKERNLADLPNPALARQNLQLGDSSTKNTGTTANTVAAGDDARITGAMQKSQNGADIPDVAKFLQNLGLDTALAGKQAKDDTLTALSGQNVAQLLTYLTLGPIANAADIAAGSANKLIDAYGLNSYFPSRRFGTSGYIRIPNQPGGLILQWGPIPGIPAGGHVTVSYGFAFPEAYLVVIPIAGSSSGAANSVLSGGAGDPKLSFQVFNSLPGVTDGTGTGAYIALGF